MEAEQKKKELPRILIVDDISMNVKILENIIQAEGYEALCALSVQEALDIMKNTIPHLILSDFSMPGMNGVEFCKLLKSNPKTREIPFIFITVADSSEEKKQAFSAGAADFIPKPIERIEVVMRVNNQLNSYKIKQEMENYNRMMHKMVIEQKKQMDKEKENLLLALAKVVEKRDIHKSEHLDRVGYNCRILAQSMQLIPKYENLITDEFIETIELASRLQNIGNIVLSDEVLLKSEEKNKDRLEAIKLHTEEGANFLETIRSGNGADHFIDMAVDIARYHHANWDGSGYPCSVKEEEIPLSARITSLANDLECIIEKYQNSKEDLTDRAVEIMNEGRGTIYDPYILDVFNKVVKQLRIT